MVLWVGGACDHRGLQVVSRTPAATRTLTQGIRVHLLYLGSLPDCEQATRLLALTAKSLSCLSSVLVSRLRVLLTLSGEQANMYL